MSALRRGLVRVLRLLVGGLLLLILALAFTQVVLRYAFAGSILWVEEVSVMALAWMTWAGAACLWLQRGHLAVDLFAGAGGARWRARIARAVDAVAVLAGFALIHLAQRTLQAFFGIEMGSLELDAGIKYYPVLAGGAGLALAALVNLVSPPEPGRP